MQVIFFICFFTLSLYAQAGQFTLPFPNEPELEKETKQIETEVILPQNSSLPNQKDGAPTKKKKGEKAVDPYAGPYPRGMYQLQRSETQKALNDFNQASSGEGGANTNQAKLETVRILSLEKKVPQAKTIADGIEDPDTKYKAYFEIASGIENGSTTKQEREECIPLYLQILSDAPREAALEKKGKDKAGDMESFNPILPRTRWALSNLLYKSGEFSSALDHLSRLILDYPRSEYLDDALYLSGKIHEEGNSSFPRDTKRAMKYYEIFLNKKEKEPFKSSIYLQEVEKRLKAITPNIKSFGIQ